MDVTDLARLQFAVTTVYHYLFVPLSMSLSLITALLHTAWLRSGRDELKRVTVLCGQLLLITFAVGVVTGLVQEFQFGLAWSSFARFYGDVFGPVLAIEGMLAFFLEATFLGLWFFGWDRLPRACTWPPSGWSRSAPSCRRSSSCRPTRSCRTRSATRSTRRPAGPSCTISPRCCSTSSTWLLPARGHRCADDGRRAAAGHLTVGTSCGGPGRSGCGPDPRPGRSLGRGRRRGRRLDHRRHPGQGDHRGPADEDGGRGGALQHHHGRSLLPLHLRPLGGVRGRDQHRHPAPALLPGHRQLQRHRPRHRRSAGPVRAAVRPGELRAWIPVAFWSFR